jgi:hypothetical protein
MHKYQKKKKNLIKYIINFINLDEKLKKIFYHPNRKYKLEKLLEEIIKILKSGKK